MQQAIGVNYEDSKFEKIGGQWCARVYGLLPAIGQTIGIRSRGGKYRKVTVKGIISSGGAWSTHTVSINQFGE